ncbi:MAG TPA: hypothetical protein PL011_08080, partial [Kiritimatiellia bacterium]|nr:hypothetical protein [Kiritimatiellia bacterium]
MIKNAKIWVFFGFFAFFLVILPWIGAERLDFGGVWGGFWGSGTPDSRIFLQLRLPRVWMGLWAGGVLG